MSIGKDITPSDNDKAFLEANDEIRGVDTTCYGDCPSGTCLEDSITIHNILWKAPTECVDGGVMRAKSTYTNLETSGFKTPIGYSGHFYGIRKYDGLVPYAPYNIVIQAQTGSNESITVPPEFKEVEYGNNDYVGYSGIKLVAPYSYRSSGDKYGKSVAIKNNIMAVGAPMTTIPYTEYDSSGNLVTYNLEKTGTVYIYNRENRPSGSTWPVDKDSSPWILDSIVTLPSSILKDYYTERTTNSVDGFILPLPVTERIWEVGQEGREFGHSISLSSSSGTKHILAVGAPSAKWNYRNFQELQVSGVQICVMVFTDEFTPSYQLRNEDGDIIKDGNGNSIIKTESEITNSLKNKDLIFQYFSNPPVKFDVKVLICQPLADNDQRIIEEFPQPKPDYIFTNRIARNQSFVTQTQTEKILSGIKDTFHKAFPYDPSKLNNNIPPLLSFYIDDSASLGRESISPAIDLFLDYYQQYSFASGLVDFYNQPSSGIVTEYISNFGEGWIDVTTNMLNYILDTGRLVSDNQVRYFTSGVGLEAFNNNLSQFNYPPSSGGRVFIFEQESGSWNLIQQIKADSTTYKSFDRFGHSVNISDNGELLVIGSPYTNETCKAFEYKSTETQRLLSQISSWLSHKSSITGGSNIRYTTLLNNYQQWLSNNGFAYANKALYDSLTPSEKFEARQYLNIQEYQNIFNYNGTIGKLDFGSEEAEQWKIIIDRYAATTRLGYSTAVNEDGSIIAFGAPTDSFNKFDDPKMYYKNRGYNNPINTELNSNYPLIPSWSSSVNAGAVRVFESRKYYPHSKVIEYGKFGNLQKTLGDPLDSGHFNYLSTIFQNENFEITPFTQNIIPEDVGLVFIITPEIDAASDETINNIIDWLALGDRNLVLVGNDPVWENDGIYAKSNDIINKILNKLDTRMKLYPARNKTEASVSGCGKAISSFRPFGGTDSYIQAVDMNIHGVADIRTNFDNLAIWKNINLSMPCEDSKNPSLRNPNSKCELPLKNIGDLRSQWNVRCFNCAGREVIYQVNFPYLFSNFTPDCCEEEDLVLRDIRINLANQDPVPILAVADYKTNTVTIPAVPERYGFRPKYESETLFSFSYKTYFDTQSTSTIPSFVWNASGNNATYINYNHSNTTSKELFYQPVNFENRQGLLQANAIPAQEIIPRTVTTNLVANLAAEDQYNSTSKIITIGSLDLETENFLYLGNDANINFYINLISKSGQRGGSRIAQLGGWTGRTSFRSAKTNSILYEVFNNTNNEVILNASNLSIIDDVCWICNPINLPSEEELAALKNWLNFPNKKLIITYDSEQAQARLIKNLLELLGSNLKPIYSLPDEKFHEVIYPPNGKNLKDNPLTINPLHFSAIGSRPSFNINKFRLYDTIKFIPMENVQNTTPIISVDTQIFETVYDTVGYWSVNTGLAKASFPAIAGSGYQIFISSVSESPNENLPIDLYITNCKRDFGPVSSVDGIGNNVGIIDSISNINQQNIIKTRSYTAQAIEGADSIDVYFQYENPRLSITTSSYIPKTTRIIGISGALCPIKTERIPEATTIQKFVGNERYLMESARPEQTITYTVLAPLSNLNNQYCESQDCIDNGLGNQEIADGPVVAAQEVEHITSFNAGFSRSRITLLADSSLVQGKCLGDDNFRTSANAVAFIRSLYPYVNFPSSNLGRQYNISEKIVAPDRGSPQKYYSLVQNSGINKLFNGVNSSSGSLSSFTTLDSSYDPKFVIPPSPIYTIADDEILKNQKINEALSDFANLQLELGGSAKFSGIIENKIYVDAGIDGGMPDIMKDTGYDYLDFERFPSGYPGDLFGYSISISKDKLVIGSPFSAFSQEQPIDWSYFINNGNSGVQLGYNGGAGAVYIYERNFNGSGLHGSKSRWEMVQKIRPESINIGQDLTTSGSAIAYIGNHGYTDTYLTNHSIISDRFGASVDIASDVLAIGAPGHDFGNFIENGSGDFIRKSFNDEFYIPDRTVYDLGLSGNRSLFVNSGITILNNGAIFTFENSIIDWENKKQKWKFVEKIIPQGSGLKAYGSENDYFGESVKINRCFRSDADYVIIGGAKHHAYDTSGNNNIKDAGAIYSHDIMLREQPPSVSSPLAYIDARIFGEKDNNNQPEVRIVLANSGQNSVNYYSSGIIYADNKGQVFIEVSGQDPTNKGFITHRPYIVSIDGKYAFGTQNSGQLSLFIDAKGGDSSGNINLFSKVDNSSIVYNNLGLYNGAIIDFATNLPSGLYLYIDCPAPISISESGLCLYTASGIGINNDALNLRIRGK